MKNENYNIPASFRYARTKKDISCSKCSGKILKGDRRLNVVSRIMGWWSIENFCSNCDLERINDIPETDSSLKQSLLNLRATFANQLREGENKK